MKLKLSTPERGNQKLSQTWKKIFTFSFSLAVLLLISTNNLKAAHPGLDSLDIWIEVNDGLGKCAMKIGESGTYLNFKQDNFDIRNIVHRRGLLYVDVTYGAGTNPEACKDGWFVHDTIENKWKRVAYGAPQGYYGNRIIRTNGREIFEYNNGMVYQMTFDYATYPTGWKTISKAPHAPLGSSHINSALSTNSDCYTGDILSQALDIDAIGDTIFAFLIPRTGSSNCVKTTTSNTLPVVAKFNIYDGYWTFEKLPVFPRDAQFTSGEITDYIAGHFRYFISYREPYKNLPTRKSAIGNYEKDPATYTIKTETDGKICAYKKSDNSLVACWDGFEAGYTTDLRYEGLPKAVWVFDPRNNQWRDISRGPNWCNFTGSEATGGSLTVSWDKSRILMSNQQGSWEWQGDRWDFMNDRVKDMSIVTTNGIFYEGADHSGSLGGGGENIERFINANFMILGPLNDPHNVCAGETYNTHYRSLSSANDGKTIYGFLWEKDMHCYDSVKPEFKSADGQAYYGVYYLKPDERKPQSSRNLHVEAATYLGGSGNDNYPVNVGVGQAYRIFVAGNFSGNQGSKSSNYFTKNYNGATSASRGKILVLSKYADTLLGEINLGNTIYDYEIQSYGDYRMLVCGSWGITLLDSTGNELWSKTQAQLSVAPYNLGWDSHDVIIGDIDNDGHVVIMRGKEGSGDGDGDVYIDDANFIILDKNGNPLTSSTSVKSGYTLDDGTPKSGAIKKITDVTILRDTVFTCFMVTENFKKDPKTMQCADAGGYVNQPISSPWVIAFAKNGSGKMKKIWRTFGFDSEELYGDMADAIPYKLNIGNDGVLYFLGESANTNGVYRWDGKTTMHKQYLDFGNCNNIPSKLTNIDKYSATWGMKGATHVGFFCTLDPATGYIQRSQFLIPRTNDNTGNSFFSKSGYITADAKGYVYIGGQAAARYANREVQYINGKLIGDYNGGDGTVLVMSPDYRSRTFWGAFSDTVASGYVCGIAVKDNRVAMLHQSEQGKLITGGTKIVNATYGTKQFKREWAINQEPLNLNWKTDPVKKMDTYLAVWYQDLWNYSQDTLEPNPIGGDTIISHEAFNCKVEFRVKEIPVPDKIEDNKEVKIDVCVGQEITFEDLSECAEGWEWDFGAGARVGPQYLNSQAVGQGPWKVKFTTPGLVTIKLTVKLKSETTNGVPTYIWQAKEKFDYINVIDNNIELANIKGGTSFCSGTETYFETDNVYGLKGYEWTVPAGTKIEDGANGNKIRVTLGNTSGTIVVKGILPCGGFTTAKSLPITVNTASENSVLMVTGDDKIVVDNDGAGYSMSPTDITSWADRNQIETGLYGYHGANYRKFEFKNTSFTATLNYAPTLPSAGYYEVFIRYPFVNSIKGENYFDKVPLKIEHKNGTANLTLAQLQTGGEWISLGTYEFNAGNNIVAKIIMNKAKMHFWADAFAWKKVTGTPILAKGDSAIYNRLTMTLGKTVTVKTDAEVLTTDAGCASMVYLSNTADENKVTFKFKDVKVPVMCSNPNLYSFIGLSYAGGNKGEIVNQNKVDIANPSHEMAGGLTGQRTVYNNTNNNLQYGSPTGTADIIATIPGDPTKAAVFAYDNSCPLQGTGMAAPDRRIAFFLDKDGGSNLTADGWKLFDRSICWGFKNCASISGSNTINITAFENNVCPGDSLQVTFNATGIYNADNGSTCNAANRFAVVLSNQYGSFPGSSIELGHIVKSTAGTYTMKVALPISLVKGDYRIKVISSSPSAESTPSAVINIKAYPENAGEITGPKLFCLNQTPIGTYTVTGVGLEYEWEIPMGAKFTSHVAPPPYTYLLATTSKTVTIDFQESTERYIKVRMKDGCGWSLNASEIVVDRKGTPPGPNVPNEVSGQKIICPGGTYTYTVPLIYYADSYTWSVEPASFATIVKSDYNSFTVKATNNDNTTGKIKVFATNTCGNTPVIEVTVKTDKNANLPFIDGGITVTPTICAGQYKLSIKPVNDAESYNWTFNKPTEVTTEGPTPMVNSLDVTFTKPGSHIVTATATNGCGFSSKNTTINVAASGNRALLLVNNKSTLTTSETAIKTRLEGMGYAVSPIIEADDLGAGVYCNQVMVISADNLLDADSKRGSKYKNIDIPIVALNNFYSNNDNILNNLGMTDKNTYGGAQIAKFTASKTKINIVSNCHPITDNFSNGVATIFSTATNLAWGKTPATATILAYEEGNTTQSPLFVYNKGDKMFNGNAPARRVSFPASKDAAQYLNTEGWALFDKSVQWATGDIGTPELKITGVSKTKFCAGSTGTVSFTIGGSGYATDKTIEVQLSNEFGSFDDITTIGTITTKTSGTINISMLSSLKASNNYRIRLVISSCGITVLYPQSIAVEICCVLSDVTAGATTPVCVGKTINLTATGGATYKWAGPDAFTSTQQNPVIASATLAKDGEYSVTVTGAPGCSEVKTVTVKVDNIPTPTVTPNINVCTNNPINFTASGGTSYSWTGPNSFSSSQQNPTIGFAAIVNAGVYNVKVSNDAGCTATGTTTVAISESVTITASGNSPVCIGKPIELKSSGGTSYKWTGPNGFVSNSNDTSILYAATINAGTYTIKVTNAGGCSATQTVDIAVKPSPTATASSNSPVCEGIQLNLTGGDNGMVKYEWTGENSFTSNSQSPLVSTTATAAMSGSYTLKVTDGSGCTNIATTTVVVNTSSTPSDIVGNPTPLECSATNQSYSVTLNPGSSYIWTVPSGATITSGASGPDNNAIIVDFGTSNGNVTVKEVNAFGCTSSAKTMTINMQGCSFTPNFEADKTKLCQNDTVIYTNISSGTSGSETYDWNFGADATPATATGAGPHKVVYATSGAKTVVLTVVDLMTLTETKINYITVDALPTVVASNNSPVCAGNAVNFTATGGVSYVWSGVSGFSAITSNPTIAVANSTHVGAYSVTATDANGCKASGTTSLVLNDKLTVVASSNAPACSGDSLKMSATGDINNTYIWTGPNGFNAIGQSILVSETALVNMSGQYSVNVIDANNCNGTATVNVTVNESPIITVTPSKTIACEGETIKFTADGVESYIWQGGETTSEVTLTAISTLKEYSAIGSKTYLGGKICKSASTKATVEVNALPTGWMISAVSGSVNVCEGVEAEYTFTNIDPYAIPVSTIWKVNGGELSPNPNVSLENAKITGAAGLNIIVVDYTDMLTGCSNTTTKTITVNPNDLNIDFDVQNESCADTKDGRITATITGGTAPYRDGDGVSISQKTTLDSLSAGSYEFTVLDNAGCKASKTKQIFKGGEIQFNGLTPTDAICYQENGMITIYADGDNLPLRYFVNGMPYLTNEIELPAGEYHIEIGDAKNCPKLPVESVVISEPDAIEVAFVANDAYCPDQPDGSILIKEITGGNPGSTGYTLFWTKDNSSERRKDKLPAGEHILQVTDSIGCMSKDIIITIGYTNEKCITIYTAFSPNGDGVNDTWSMPTMYSLYPTCVIEVFNRNGEQVFKSKGYEKPWDGKYKGIPLPSDTYHFIVTLNNGEKPITGQVTIVR